MLKPFPDDWWKKYERRVKRDAFEHHLRHQVLGLLHSGRLHPGDRLPSIRELAQQSGVDHRAVADAYRAMADAGLVEIRATSGVFVAAGGERVVLEHERADWLAQILFDGWTRRVSRSALLDLVSRCLTRRLRCGCVESNEDHMVALASEIERDFSVEPVPLLLDGGSGEGALAPERLGGVDLVVTSVFHGAAARAAGARANRPVVVATFNQEFTLEIDRRLRERPITTVHVDPRYADRGRQYFAVTAHRDRVRFVSVDELTAEPVRLDADDVLITRAARRRLGLEDYHLIPSPPSLVSPETARQLSRAIVEVCLGEGSAR